MTRFYSTRFSCDLPGKCTVTNRDDLKIMHFSVACLVLKTLRTYTGYRDTLKVTVWCKKLQYSETLGIQEVAC